jgi:hypothetical protein
MRKHGLTVGTPVGTSNSVLVHNVLTLITCISDGLHSWIASENLVSVNIITVVLMNKLLHCLKKSVCSDVHWNILTVFAILHIEMVITISHFLRRHYSILPHFSAGTTSIIVRRLHIPLEDGDEVLREEGCSKQNSN